MVANMAPESMPKSLKGDPRRPKGDPKAIQRRPKATQMDQRDRKGRPKGTKVDQRGFPKWIKNLSKIENGVLQYSSIGPTSI